MHVDGTSFGSITVDGKVYRHDLWIFTDGSIRRRNRDHEFTLDEFLDLLGGRPEVVVVGTGQADCVRVEEAVREEARRRGVELVSAKTPAAVQDFNDALERGRRVAAAFHVTC